MSAERRALALVANLVRVALLARGWSVWLGWVG
jgi:hypothetical protein